MATLTNGGAIMAGLLILAAAFVIVAYARHTRHEPRPGYAPACISDVAPLGTYLAHNHGVCHCEPYDQETA